MNSNKIYILLAYKLQKSTYKMHRGDSSQKRKKQFGSLLMLADVTPLQLTKRHFLAKEKEPKQALKKQVL